MRQTDLSVFLTLSRCRLLDHYQPKLQACLERLGHEQLWAVPQPGGHAIGAIIGHLLEHMQRHTVWITTGERISSKLEVFFPATKDSPEQLWRRAQQILAAWSVAMVLLIDAAERGDGLPESSPDMHAIYHLVEHVAYHMGQVILATQQATGEAFQFCQCGNDERALRAAVARALEG